MFDDKKNKFTLLTLAIVGVVSIFILEAVIKVPPLFSSNALLLLSFMLAASALLALHYYRKNFLSRYLQTAVAIGSCALLSSLILLGRFI